MRFYRVGLGILAAGGVFALAVWGLQESNWLSGQSDGSAGADASEPVTAKRLPLDDSGFTIAWRFLQPIKNPRSLEALRDAFQGAADRGLAIHEGRLANPGLTADEQFESLFIITQLNLYEGRCQHAAAALARARALAETDRRRYAVQLATIIFLQGVTQLRRGETENCVECQCQGSCILPLRPEAVHQNSDGSRQAVRYFTEYLRGHPDDDGVRWLLNIAYMTLGEYPDKVPADQLLPPSAFTSKIDIGRFRDIAPALGLNRFNQSGGAIMEDFDNDGLLDLVITSLDPALPMQLYRNQGDGTFEERSRAAGLDKQLGGLNCVQTDYNNDGWMDIYVARGAWTRTPQRHSLLRNNGDGTFTDVTREAGLDTPIDGQVAVWADYDNDGYVDLFVGGETSPCRLYHNRGDGRFTEVAEKAGVTNDRFTKGASWGDFDGDGYPDLFVSNLGGHAKRLYRNNRDGTFSDVAPALDVTGPNLSFACWFWDYDNDGWLDIWVNTYEFSLNDLVRSELRRPHKGDTCRLYRNLQGKAFKDVSAEVGLNLSLCPMGSNFADIDNDGFLDMYLGTGNPNYSTLVPNKMLKNVEGKSFVDITASSGTGHLQKGHAVAFGDWANRGYVDLFAQLGGATPGDQFRNALFHNPCQGNHSLKLRLVGKKTNRAAIGARIKVIPGEPGALAPGVYPKGVQRHVTSGGSFGGNTLQQMIGLGKATRIARLEIYWPTSKTTQIFTDLDADQSLEITEFGEGYRKIDEKRVPIPQ